MLSASMSRLAHPAMRPFVVDEIAPTSCPLGQIDYAGAKWNSYATYEHAPAPDFMRINPKYLIVLTLEGEADYIDDTGVKATLREGSLMWARPGINQSYGPRPGQRWSELFVWFSGPIFDTWQAQGFPGNQTRILQLSPLPYWVARLRKLVQPSQRTPGETALSLLCRFQALLADALSFGDKSTRPSEKSTWISQATRLLDGGHCSNPSLEEIARSLGLSYTIFRKRFVEAIGQSPARYRAEKIIHRAANRLLGSETTLSQISEDLGFQDAFHFSRRFKQIMGVAPQEFRKQSLLHQNKQPRLILPK